MVARTDGIHGNDITRRVAAIDVYGPHDESFNLLAQAQTRTEERLNIFINVVERHISGNGGSESRA